MAQHSQSKTTRAITPIGTNLKVQRMNTGFSRATVRVPPRRRDSFRLGETIPFWFAVSSPLIGLVVGVGGAWLFSWLTS
ncbi:MAG: hypothetical protein DMF31_09935 [Verrucomicrobia bacterium]|nr:MAG: hypothetical protein DMF31_09935 [Verrucomicrobiota bacterium]